MRLPRPLLTWPRLNTWQWLRQQGILAAPLGNLATQKRSRGMSWACQLESGCASLAAISMHKVEKAHPVHCSRVRRATPRESVSNTLGVLWHECKESA